MSKLKSLEEILETRVSPFDPCIYFLIRGEQIVYVGQSLYKGSRTPAHIKEKTFDSISFVSCKREDLSDLEAEYILKFNPIYNSTMPLNSKYATLKMIATEYGVSKREVNKVVKKFNINPAGTVRRLYQNNWLYVEYYEIQLIIEALNV